ncbi:MAG TPA: hemolysin family protein, partial [Acidobacteriota bacterium]|nr:hemolysin family protein [Acidobacteriota bacterium]
MFLSMGRPRAESDLRRQTIDTKFIDFSGRRVREVMVPRPFVKAIEINTPLRQILAAVTENRYSRIPVFRSSLDNILGILHVKDVIAAEEPYSLEGHLRKPFFIPESATVQAAFQDMRRNRVHLAIVVDEYGGVDGIVTLEDLIEELVGEIHDEYDEDVEMLHKVNDGWWMLEGNLQVKDLNQNLGLDLPEDPPSYTTIAGFLISILDKIPSEKEQIRYGNLLFTVEKMLGNKIARVSLKMPQPARETTAH